MLQNILHTTSSAIIPLLQESQKGHFIQCTKCRTAKSPHHTSITATYWQLKLINFHNFVKIKTPKEVPLQFLALKICFIYTNSRSLIILITYIWLICCGINS